MQPRTLRILGVVFGLAFLLGGALSFAPGVVKDGLYLGLFRVNPPHNLMHIATGAMFLIASAAGARFTRLWFQTFGVFYGTLAVVGLWVGEGLICGVISNNRIDAWGHAGLALAMLAIGFAPRAKRTVAA